MSPFLPFFFVGELPLTLFLKGKESRYWLSASITQPECPKGVKDGVKSPKAFGKTHIYGHMFQETQIATNLLSIIPVFCTCSLLKLVDVSDQ